MWKRMFWFLFDNRGEVGAEGKEIPAKGDEKTLTQVQVDAIVQDRLAREKAKYSDYEDLRKFKSEHEKELEVATQKELEAKKEYDKLKEGWTKKEQEFQGLITQKDSMITDMKIGNSLMSEIVKQNAYAEETMALIKSQAVFDKESNLRIKGRDANGLEVLDSVEEGIKKFLVQRPHLVKATKKDGGGTGAGAGTGTGAGVGLKDLSALNAELMAAQGAQDHKLVKELKTKIRSALTSQGVSI